MSSDRIMDAGFSGAGGCNSWTKFHPPALEQTQVHPELFPGFERPDLPALRRTARGGRTCGDGETYRSNLLGTFFAAVVLRNEILGHNPLHPCERNFAMMPRVAKSGSRGTIHVHELTRRKR